MKKYKILTMGCCIILFCSISCFGQVQKSDQNLSLGFDMNSLSGDNGENRTNLFLSYTYYLSNRISLGFGPRFGWTKDANDSKSNTKGYNVFMNYSFLTKGGFVLPYLGVQFSKVSQKQEGNDDPLVTNSIGGNFGLRFFITERFNIDNNFSYTRVISGNDTLDELGIDADGTIVQLNISLGYIIGRKN